MNCQAFLLACGLLAASVAHASAASAAPAVPSALLTIADGPVAVLRGRARFIVTEGHRLQPMDIVQTDAGTRVARLEFGDGTVLDLGPSTQVLLQPAGAAWPKERAATAYVAQGWAKLRTADASSVSQAIGLASATLDLAAPVGGVVLAHIDRRAAFAFVESGRAQLVEYRPAREPRVFELGEGHAYSRGESAETGTATLRPAATQLRDTPPALTDTLPRRASEWATRAAPTWSEPQALPAHDVALWLDSEPALRKALRARLVEPTHSAGGAAASSQARRSLAVTKPTAARPVRVALLSPSRLVNVATRERNALPSSLAGEHSQEPLNFPRVTRP